MMIPTIYNNISYNSPLQVLHMNDQNHIYRSEFNPKGKKIMC